MNNIRLMLICCIVLVVCTACGRREVINEVEEESRQEQFIKNIAILGMDGGEVRADVIFIVRLDSQSGSTDIISIPRDTKVEWEPEEKEAMYASKGYTVPVSKINEMLVYGGKENIRALTLHEIENILEISIDNYMIVDIEGFNRIIDAIGGIKVDVPQRMYYVDQSQDLYIDLQPGMQVLDGKQAEMLVRFRKYPEGDIERIRTQHIFLKAFSNKLLSPQMIINLPKIVPIVFGSIETDITFKEVMAYLPFVSKFDVNKMTYNIIPGEGEYEDGISYFFIDEEALGTLRHTMHTTIEGASD